MLRFHAKSTAKVVNGPSLPCNLAIEKIARIELQPWLCRKHFQNAPGGGFVNGCNDVKFAVRLVNDPVMVVTIAKL